MAAIAAGGRVDMTVEQAGTFLAQAGMLACRTPPDFRQALQIVQLVREWFRGIAGSLNMHRQFQGNSSYLQAEAERMTVGLAIDALRSLLLMRRRSRRPIQARQWDRQLYLFSRGIDFLMILNHERPGAARITGDMVRQSAIAAINRLERLAYEELDRRIAELPEADRAAARAYRPILRDSIHFLTRVLIFVTGVGHGIIRGLIGIVEGIFGLIFLLYKIVETIVTFALGLGLPDVELRRRARRQFTDNMRALQRIPSAIRQAFQAWRRRFDAADDDTKVYMVGEVFGEILTLIIGLLAGGGGAAARGGGAGARAATFSFSLNSIQTPAFAYARGGTMAAQATRSTAGLLSRADILQMAAVSTAASSASQRGGGSGRGHGTRGSDRGHRRRVSRPTELIRMTDDFIESLGLRGSPQQIDRLNNAIQNLYNTLQVGPRLQDHLNRVARIIRAGRSKFFRSNGTIDIDNVTALIQIERRIRPDIGLLTRLGARAERRAIIRVLRDPEVQRIRLIPDPSGNARACDAMLYYRSRGASYTSLRAASERLEIFTLTSSEITADGLANALRAKIRRGQLLAIAEDVGLTARNAHGTLFISLNHATAADDLLRMANEALNAIRDSHLWGSREVRRIRIYNANGRTTISVERGRGRHFFSAFTEETRR